MYNKQFRSVDIFVILCLFVLVLLLLFVFYRSFFIHLHISISLVIPKISFILGQVFFFFRSF
ncbi:hypothetical protein F4810DRAFT_686437, partial [Camillea tinctor]